MTTIRDFGLIPGILSTGEWNAITDVPGVTVGHHTIRQGAVNTGVTAILAHGGNHFALKPRAAVEVFNGFGKSAGLIQVDELGTVETPILLTNTFGVGACINALIRRALAENPEIGRTTGTVNPVVFECNDGVLSDIRAMAVTEADAEMALASAATGPVVQGVVGAGVGMTAFGFKGGIGTASRRLDLDGERFHLGALVLANFGKAGDLVLPDGRRPNPRALAEAERGSVIVVMATDMPLSDRQLKRVVRRAGAGLARLGAFWGHGSGDIALLFTTADPVRHFPSAAFSQQRVLDENRIDLPFRAAAEATAEAVLNALASAEAIVGRDGATRPGLSDWLTAAGTCPGVAKPT